VQLYIEPFPRVHLARRGTIEDLRASVQAAEQTADDLLRTAVEVAGEFLAGRHLFQQDLALRGQTGSGSLPASRSSSSASWARSPDRPGRGRSPPWACVSCSWATPPPSSGSSTPDGVT
jgi:hypothetical protein